MDNADLLTAAAALLERYRVEEHELELEMSCLQTRLAVMRDVVASLSGKPRGRPRKVPPRIVEPTELRLELEHAQSIADSAA